MAGPLTTIGRVGGKPLQRIVADVPGINPLQVESEPGVVVRSPQFDRSHLPPIHLRDEARARRAQRQSKKSITESHSDYQRLVAQGGVEAINLLFHDRLRLEGRSVEFNLLQLSLWPPTERIRCLRELFGDNVPNDFALIAGCVELVLGDENLYQQPKLSQEHQIVNAKTAFGRPVKHPISDVQVLLAWDQEVNGQLRQEQGITIEDLEWPRVWGSLKGGLWIEGVKDPSELAAVASAVHRPKPIEEWEIDAETGDVIHVPTGGPHEMANIEFSLLKATTDQHRRDLQKAWDATDHEGVTMQELSEIDELLTNLHEGKALEKSFQELRGQFLANPNLLGLYDVAEISRLYHADEEDKDFYTHAVLKGAFFGGGEAELSGYDPVTKKPIGPIKNFKPNPNVELFRSMPEIDEGKKASPVAYARGAAREYLRIFKAANEQYPGVWLLRGGVPPVGSVKDNEMNVSWDTEMGRYIAFIMSVMKELFNLKDPLARQLFEQMAEHLREEFGYTDIKAMMADIHPVQFWFTKAGHINFGYPHSWNKRKKRFEVNWLAAQNTLTLLSGATAVFASVMNLTGHLWQNMSARYYVEDEETGQMKAVIPWSVRGGLRVICDTTLPHNKRFRGLRHKLEVLRKMYISGKANRYARAGAPHFDEETGEPFANQHANVRDRAEKTGETTARAEQTELESSILLSRTRAFAQGQMSQSHSLKSAVKERHVIEQLAKETSYSQEQLFGNAAAIMRRYMVHGPDGTPEIDKNREMLAKIYQLVDRRLLQDSRQIAEGALEHALYDGDFTDLGRGHGNEASATRNLELDGYTPHQQAGVKFLYYLTEAVWLADFNTTDQDIQDWASGVEGAGFEFRQPTPDEIDTSFAILISPLLKKIPEDL